ncbi:MAG: hypothetical protein ACPGWR_19025 [Ardenticatenaceae bacterium]
MSKTRKRRRLRRPRRDNRNQSPLAHIPWQAIENKMPPVERLGGGALRVTSLFRKLVSA